MMNSRTATRRLLAAGLWLAAATGAEAGVLVQPVWTNAPIAAPGGGVFRDAAPLPGGGWQVSAGPGVFSLNPNGSVTPLTSSPPERHAKRIPGSDLVLKLQTRVEGEEIAVDGARILRPDGGVAAELAAPGLEISRVLPDRILYSLPDSLHAVRLDGTELWRAGVAVHKFESAADRTILVPRRVPGRVIHLDGPREASSTRVDGVVWNLAIAPGGRYSAATTKTTLYLFDRGTLLAEVRLPLAYANTLDVSDRGEVLIGGQGERGDGHVLLYQGRGELAWRTTTSLDRNAYRPAVRFNPAGDGFLVLERRGASAYTFSGSKLP